MNIIEQTAIRMGVKPEDITGNRRQRKLVMIRHGIIWYLRKRHKLPLTAIGKIMNRDHTTIIYSISKVDDYLHTNDTLYRPVHNAITSGIIRESDAHCEPCDGVKIRHGLEITIPLNNLP